jgi:hypothetical protein
MGKSTISMIMASIAMLNYQRVHHGFHHGKMGDVSLIFHGFHHDFHHQKPWKMRENYGPFTDFFQSWRCST